MIVFKSVRCIEDVEICHVTVRACNELADIKEVLLRNFSDTEANVEAVNEGLLDLRPGQVLPIMGQEAMICQSAAKG